MALKHVITQHASTFSLKTVIPYQEEHCDPVFHSLYLMFLVRYY